MKFPVSGPSQLTVENYLGGRATAAPVNRAASAHGLALVGLGGFTRQLNVWSLLSRRRLVGKPAKSSSNFRITFSSLASHLLNAPLWG